MLGAKCRGTSRGAPVGPKPVAGSGGPQTFDGTANLRAPGLKAVTNRTKSGSTPGQKTRLS